MQLSELLSGINYIDVKGNTDLNISSLSCDSRRVKKDGLFFCLEGTQTERAYIRAQSRRGRSGSFGMAAET